jgi:hypothetical protein
MAFLDHESMRMWMTFATLGILWGCGLYCYKRFIIHPRPEEKSLD